MSLRTFAFIHTMSIKEIKKEFFALRNGMLADTLRKAGMPYGIIFGLNVPQISAIAKAALNDPETDRDTLARQLWEDSNVRESRLLACYMFDPATLSEDAAISLATEALTREEADMLAFRLLRNLPYAEGLADKIPAATPVAAYSAEALRRNLQ